MKRQHLTLSIALLSFLLINSPVHASTFTAFGPKTFVRGSGKPVIETVSFNIKNLNTSYMLKIYNGGINSEYSKVSSAIIKLNGSSIFDTNDFSQQAPYLQKQVSINKNNDLSVELRSAPGSGFTVLIEGEDSVSPSVIINSPANGTYLNNLLVPVNGNASDSISWVNTVNVNGTAAQLSGESYYSSIQLTEGANNITATSTDAAGNTENVEVSVIIDTTPPQITIDPVPYLTNKPQLTITGNIEDASPITGLTINGTSVGAIGQSPFQFSSDITLSEGSNTITVTATDKAGNSANTTAIVVLDTTPPTVTIASPVNQATLNTASLTVIGTSTDALSAVGTVTINGTSAAINGDTYTSTIQLKEGENTVTVTATDKAGNTTASSIAVKIDTTPPSIAITSPANGSTIATGTITVIGTIDDNTATVTINGINATISNITFTASVINLTDGANTVTVIATDKAGNASTVSIAITYTSKPAPIITMTSPVNGSTSNLSLMQVRGTIDDPTATVKINGDVAVVSNCNEGPLGPREPAPRFGETCTGGYIFLGYVNLMEGANTIIITATDSGGNTTGKMLTVYLDAAPVIAVTYPLSGSILSTNKVTITGTIDDSTATVSRMQWDYNPGLGDWEWVEKYADIVTGNTFEFSDVQLNEGYNYLAVKATDSAGNETWYAMQVNVDTIDPVITITFPAEDTYARGGNGLFITGSINEYSIVTINGEAYNGCATCRFISFTKGVSLNEGPNNITITATDQAGNVGSKSIVVYFDNTPPVVTITSPVSGSTVTTSIITVTGTIDEEYLDSLYVYNGTTQTKTTISELTNNTFTGSGVQLANGLNYIYAVAIDKARNISNKLITITYQLNTDTTSPFISLLSPTKITSVNTSTITVLGYIDDNTATTTVNGITAIVANNRFTAYNVPLSIGPNTITVIAKDTAGNETKYTFTLTYDITLPTVTSTSPAFNAIDVPLDSKITITFSEKMSNVTDNTFIVSSESGQIAGIITCDGGTATFIPTKPLRPSTVYTATIKSWMVYGESGARDYAGNTIAADYAWVFKTVTLPIEITEPSDGDTINKATAMIRGRINYQTQEVGIKVNGILAEVNGSNWSVVIALHIGQNTVEAVAVDGSGNTNKQTITINTNTVQQPVTITINPQSGIAPLNASITIDTGISNPITSYKMDFEGDGVTDLTTTSPENITHTYETPGFYSSTVRITDSQGNTYSETTAINVLDRTQMDALLKGKWEGMRGAMMSGDTTRALEHFSAGSRQLYNDLFTALASQLPQIAQDMQDIQLIYLKDNAAKYRIRKNELYGGQMLAVTYYIYFSKDIDGLWKIDKF